MSDHGHPHTHSHETRRDVIVTDNGGPSVGGIVAAILGVLAILLVAWLLFFNGGGGDGGAGESIVPDEVNVNVDPGEGAGQ